MLVGKYTERKPNRARRPAPRAPLLYTATPTLLFFGVVEVGA